MFFRTAAVIFTLFIGTVNAAFGAEREFNMFVANPLIESGFVKFLLPRFSLKTGVHIVVTDRRDAAQVTFDTGSNGRPVMQGLGAQFSMAGPSGDGDQAKAAQRFVEWIFSDIGQRTITQFAPDGDPVFTTVTVVETVDLGVVFEGDEARGARLSLRFCGRCHVVSDANRMNGIGSTPSFALLRGLIDWQERFQTFHLRRPHPSFTQVEGITDSFDPAHPSPIHPLMMTEEALKDIFTYVSGMVPADLGDDLVVHQ